MTFGDNIKNLRIKNNMTQKDLAGKLNLSRPTIGRYESDERFPDKETIIDLAELFDVSIDEMFGRQKGIDNKYLKDKEFVEDLINFGYEAAVKIKLVKEEKVENK